jgi:hypothetical protein
MTTGARPWMKKRMEKQVSGMLPLLWPQRSPPVDEEPSGFWDFRR